MQKMRKGSIKQQPSSSKRSAQVEDGAYDGRYRTKVVEDKKKKAKKLWARLRSSHVKRSHTEE